MEIKGRRVLNTDNENQSGHLKHTKALKNTQMPAVNHRVENAFGKPRQMRMFKVFKFKSVHQVRRPINKDELRARKCFIMQCCHYVNVVSDLSLNAWA